MIQFIKRITRKALQQSGYDLIHLPKKGHEEEFPADFDTATRNICRLVRPYTMTSPERIFALRQAVQYVSKHKIPGDIVECGVWRGGSMMVVAKTLLERGIADKTLHLFDTFDGMSEPTAADVSFDGKSASELLSSSNKESSDIFWARSTLDEVKKNLHSTGYPQEKLVFVKGKVEETIPDRAPMQISILRLDTDWYESTYHELQYLYSRLSSGGVLIIDDYGHWAGAQKAVDTYFAENNLKLLLNRIDYTGRICVKN